MADFKLSKEEEKKIIEAIRSAEGQTSGEIRVHIQKTLTLPVYEEAAKVFLKLGMNKTDLKNGVLLFIVPNKRQFAILGDSGINKLVPENFGQIAKIQFITIFLKVSLVKVFAIPFIK